VKTVGVIMMREQEKKNIVASGTDAYFSKVSSYVNFRTVPMQHGNRRHVIRRNVSDNYNLADTAHHAAIVSEVRIWSLDYWNLIGCAGMSGC